MHITKNVKTLLQGIVVSLVVTTSAFALVIIPQGATTTDPIGDGYTLCTPGNCVIATSSSSGLTPATTTGATVYWNGSEYVPGTQVQVGGTAPATTTTNIFISGILRLMNALGINYGGTGTTTAPGLGQFLVGNSSGGYDYVSTSSLQVATSSFASSTIIGATVQNATATGIFFLDENGKLAQDTANFNYDRLSGKLTVTGGIDPLYLQIKGTSTNNNAYFEAYGGENAATSSTGFGRLRYNALTNVWEVSNNGGAYAPLAVSGGNITWLDAVGNNATVTNLSATGTAIFPSVYITNSTTTNSTTTNLFAANASITNATSTNFFASIFNAITSYFQNLGFGSATGTNLQIANSSTTNLTATGTTNLTGNTYISSTTIAGAQINSGNATLTTSVSGNSTSTNTFATNASITNATTTNLFAVVFNALTSYFQNLGFGSATGTNLQIANGSTTNLTATGTTNLTGDTYISSSTIGSAQINSGNATLTNATTTNLFSTNASITNAIVNNAEINGGNATLTNATTSNVFSTNASITNATTTNLFAVVFNALTSYFQNLGFGSATGTNLLVTNATGTNIAATGTLQVSGTSTLASTTIASGTFVKFDAQSGLVDNLVANNSTSSFSTSTNFYSENASITNATTTNLFAVVANFLTAFFDNLGFNNATGTNIQLANSSTTNLTATGTTNLTGDTYISSSTIGSAQINSGNATLTNATTTNLFSTNASITNAVVNNAEINGGNATLTNATTTNLSSSFTNAGELTAGTTTLGTTTISTSTISWLNVLTNFFANVATILNLDSTNATITNATVTNLAVTNIRDSFNATGTEGQVLSTTGTSTKWINVAASGALASGTATNSTLRWDGTNWVENTNFQTDAAGNSTSTNSTSTNLFSENASITNATTTNLFAVFANFLTAFFDNLGFNNATGTNIQLANSSTTNLTATGTTNLTGDTYISSTTIANAQINSGNATLTTAVVGNATATNLFANYASITEATTTNLFAVLINALEAIFGNATTTNATITNAFAVSGTSTLATTSASLLTLSNSLQLASTTPATSTFALYNNGGVLYWNGSAVGGVSSDLLSIYGGGATNTTSLAYRTGELVLGTTSTSTTNATFITESISSTTIAQIIRGAVGQLANLLQIQNASGTNLFTVATTGTIVSSNLNVTGTTTLATSTALQLTLGSTTANNTVSLAIYNTLTQALGSSIAFVTGTTTATTTQPGIAGVDLLVGDNFTVTGTTTVYTVTSVNSSTSLTFTPLSTGAVSAATVYRAPNYGFSFSDVLGNMKLAIDRLGSLVLNAGAYISSFTPATTTNALYNVAGSLFFNGQSLSSNTTIQNVSASTTLTTWSRTVLVDDTAGNITIVLPTATATAGQLLEIKKVSTTSLTNYITIIGNASTTDTIDGAFSYILSNPNSSVVIRSNGAGSYKIVSAQGIGNVLAENGEQAFTGALTSSSNIDATNGSFTIPSAGTWDIEVSSQALSGSATGGSFAQIQIVTATNSVIATRNYAIASVDGGTNLSGAGYVTARVTTTGATVYKIQYGNPGSGGSSVTGTVKWQKISGNVAVTGQSVDYINARQSGDISGVTANFDLVFNTAASGNIPLNTTTGVFTLTAGKTYKLDANILFDTFSSATGGYKTYEWVDGTTNTPLVTGQGGVSVANTNTTANSDQSNATTIYTPSANQTVKLRVTGSDGGTAIFRGPLSNAQITQLGTTASTEYSVTTLGDFPTGGAIMTGTLSAYINHINITQTTQGQTLTLPNPSNTSLQRIVYVNSIGSTGFTISGFVFDANQSAAFLWNGSAWKPFSSSANVVASYMNAMLGTTQSTNIANNDHIKFQTVTASYGNDITLDTASAYSSSNGAASVGRITLKAGKTYRLTYIPGETFYSGGGYYYPFWANADTGATIGSGGTGVFNASYTGNYSGGGSAETIFTPVVDTKVEVKFNGVSNLTSFNANSNFNHQVFVEVIAGNAPVIGQSVDYVNVSRGANTPTLTPNSAVVFTAINSGNIPYNTTTGLFTLTAGKTYRLNAGARMSNSGANADMAWMTSANVDLAPNNRSGNAAVQGDFQTTEVIYTPSVNTDVKWAPVAVAGSPVFDGTKIWANITQLGSSALTSDTVWSIGGNISSLASTTALAIGSITNNALSFLASTTERARITTSGFFGIGTMAPTSMLGVQGNYGRQLTGTVSITTGSSVVTGSGTLFNSELGAGQVFKITGTSTLFTVASITSATSMGIVGTSTGIISGATYFADPDALQLISGNGITLAKFGSNGGLTLASSSPVSASSTLYALGTTLYWNGTAVGTGSGGGSNFMTLLGATSTTFATATDTALRAGSLTVGTTSTSTANVSSVLTLVGNLTNTLGANISIASGSANASTTGTGWATNLSVGDAVKITVGTTSTQYFTVLSLNSSSSVQLSSNSNITSAAATVSTDNNLLSILNGNGVSKLTVDKSGNLIANAIYSDNIYSAGTNWTSRSGGGPQPIASVYGNGVYVMVGQGLFSNNISYSKDGINWTNTTTPTNTDFNSVAYGDGMFVAVPTSGLSFVTSSDGITWTNRQIPTNLNWTTVAYGNGKFVALSNGGATSTQALYSTNGISWIPTSSANNLSWKSVTFGNGKFVAVSDTGAANRQIMTSTDGITWTAATAPVANTWASVTYGGGKFVAVANSNASGNIMTSTNGTTWTTGSIVNSDASWKGITYGGGQFAIVGQFPSTGKSIMTSPDAVTWTGRTNSGFAWNNISYSNGIFVATGAFDGINTSGTLVPDNNTKNIFTSVANFVNGLVTGTTTVATSTNIAIFNTLTERIVSGSINMFNGTTTATTTSIGFGTTDLLAGDNFRTDQTGGQIFTVTAVNSTTSIAFTPASNATVTAATVYRAPNTSFALADVLGNIKAYFDKLGSLYTSSVNLALAPIVATTSNALYNVGGSLYFNGTAVGGGAVATSTITGSTTLTSWNKTYYVNDAAGAGSIVLTLPPATTSAGTLIEIKKISTTTNSITILPNSTTTGQTIDGLFGYTLLTQLNNSVTIRSNGTNYQVVSATANGNVVASYLSAVGATQANAQLTGGSEHVRFNQVINSYGGDITLDTTTSYVNTANTASIGRVTLKAGKTYEIEGDVGYLIGTGYISYQFFNSDTGVYIGTIGSKDSRTPGGDMLNAGPAKAIFTPTQDTRVELRVPTASTVGIGSTSWGLPILNVRVIAGNAAVTGQSVDYAQAFKTSTQAVSAINTDITWQTSNGNIPFSTPSFTLTAGKTYKLKAFLNAQSQNLATDYLSYVWVDSNNATITNQVVGQWTPNNDSADIYSSAPAETIYTPTSNTTVKVRVTSIQTSGSISIGRSDISGAFASSYAEITQLGTSAYTSDSIWSTQGNNFSGSGNYLLGTLNNTGLQFTASSSVLGGLSYNSTSNQGIFYIGTSTLSTSTTQNFAFYAANTGGFVSTTTSSGKTYNTLYIGTSTVSTAASTATNTNITLLDSIQLYIDGAIAKLAKKTVNGTDIAAALIIDSATSSVATTTNALYSLNGKLYYNGMEIYYGSTTTPNQVVASYIQMDNTTYVNVTTAGVNIPFTQTTAQYGNDITYNANGTFTLKAGKTYKLFGDVGSAGLPGNAYLSFAWYNLTSGGTLVGSIGERVGVSYSAGPGPGGSANMILTPTVDTVVALRLNQASGVAQLGDGQVTGTSFPTANIQVIAGQSAVTGQSVDYSFAKLTGNQTISTNPIDVNFTSVAGSIPVSSGVFTLTAGKTYSMRSVLVTSNNGSAASWSSQWVDATTNVAIGSSTNPTMSSPNLAANDTSSNETAVIYTPSTNQTVKVRFTALSGLVSTAVIYAAQSFATVEQLGTTALTSDSILAVGGNFFSNGSTTVTSWLNFGSQNNAGLQMIASGTVAGGFVFSTSTNQSTFFIGTSTPNKDLIDDFAFYMQGLGGFVSSTTAGVETLVLGSTTISTSSYASLNPFTLYSQNVGGFIATTTSAGNINTLYIGTSTVNTALASAMKDIQLYIDGSIARLAKKTVNGTDVGAALIIDMATSSVATTTNALYALNGKLYYNGAEIYYGASTTPNQVVASYLFAVLNGSVGAASSPNHILFDTVVNSFGNDIVLDTTTTYTTTTGAPSRGRIFLKAGKTYRLVAGIPGASSANNSFQWYNASTNVAISTPVNSNDTGAALGIGIQGPAATIFTPTSDTLVEVRIVQGNTVVNTTWGQPYIDIQVIAGNAAVTGQVVDNIYVNRNTNQTGITTGTDIVFNNVVGSSNIPFNTGTGVFTLSPGKTYELEANIPFQNFSAASSYLTTAWVDATTNASIMGSTTSICQPTTDTVSNSNNCLTKAIYTPSATQNVKLRVIGSSGATAQIIQSANNNINYATIKQLGSSAITSDSILSIGGNYFSNGSSSLTSWLNFGSQNNVGLQMIASGTVAGGFVYSTSTNNSTFFIGTSTPNRDLIDDFAFYMEGLGGFIASSTRSLSTLVIGSSTVSTSSYASLNPFGLYSQGTGGFIATTTSAGNISTLYIGTSTVTTALANAMKDIQLYIDGSIARLGKKTVNGTDIAAALIIDSATSSVATTTNALYSLNGKLYYNGAEIYYGASTTPNQVVASFLMVKNTITTSPGTGGHFQFDTLVNQFGNDITYYDSSNPNTNTLGAVARGRFLLKAGKTYKLTSGVPSQSSVYLGYGWYNVNAGAGTLIGAPVNSNDSGNALGYGMSGPAVAIFTPTQDTLVEVRMIGGSGSGETTNTTYGQPYATIEVIAGQSAVTGQTVDYVQAYDTVTVSHSAGTLLFDTSVGNIPYNPATGLFTLTAGKTYRLQANARTSSGSNVDIKWQDSTGANLSPSITQSSGPTNTDSGSVEIIYTPSLNIGVRVNVSGAVTGFSGGSTSYTSANITQLGTSAITSDSILSVGGNYFSNGSSSLTSWLNFGSQNNVGLQMIASGTVVGGFTSATTTNTATFFIGTSTPNTSQLANYTLYAQGAGGFVASSTLGISTLYIGTSTLGSGLTSSATQTNLLSLQNIQLYIDGAIARLAKKTVNGTDVGAALVIDSATSSVATTTNALYALNGALYYNGAQIYYGASTTQNQVLASFARMTLTTAQNSNFASTDHVKFDTVPQSFGSDIIVDTSSAYSNTNGAASIGRITLKAGKTYRLTGQLDCSSSNCWMTYAWYNSDTGTILVGGASGGAQDALSTNIGASASGIADAVFTPTVDTKVELRTVAQSASTGIRATGSSFGNTSAYIQVIAGNAAVTGTTVDYLSATQATNQNPVVGAAINYTANVQGGITGLGSGRYTLLAGKTYKLTANWAPVDNTSDIAEYQFYNVTAGAFFGQIGTGGDPGSSNSFGINAEAVITPTVNTNVEVRWTTDGATGSDTTKSSLYIVQLGSNVITSDSYIANGGNATGANISLGTIGSFAMRFIASSTEYMRLLATGQFLLGTTTINTTVGTSTLALQATTTNGSVNVLSLFGTAGNSLFNIANNGVVNIGTTTTNGSFNFQAISTSTNVFNLASSTGLNMLTLNAAGLLNNSGTIRANVGGVNGVAFQDGDNHTWETNGTSAWIFKNSWNSSIGSGIRYFMGGGGTDAVTEKFTMLGSGKFGIGSTTPSAMFSINGTTTNDLVGINNAAGANVLTIAANGDLTTTGTTSGNIFKGGSFISNNTGSLAAFGPATTNVGFYAVAGGILRFVSSVGTTPTDTMTLTSGRVSIATTSSQSENVLTLGPAGTNPTTEGGQLMLLPGTTMLTSWGMDNFNGNFRILKADGVGISNATILTVASTTSHVGIGTTTPAFRLDVADSQSTTFAAQITNTASGGTGKVLE